MRLKYYLRGLGIGMIITAVILAITTDKKEKPMSDAEIMARAEELGMVMQQNGHLDNIGDASLPEIETDTENGEEAGAGQPGDAEAIIGGSDALQNKNTEEVQPESPKEDETDTAGAQEAGGEENSGDSGTNPEGNNAPGQAANGTKVVTINEGEFSNAICQKLFEAGLVPDAEDFNRYLVEQKLDDKLSNGSYTIPVGATYEEIATILCQKAE